MKSFFIAAIVHSLFSFHHPAKADKKYFSNDTTVNHLLDGKINEWPPQKFETDPATQLKYAIDNDKRYVYLALSIPGFREQIKIMRQGMYLYIDPKGKKKEGKRIEFPVKRDQFATDMSLNLRSQGNENTDQESPEQKKAAMRTMRAEMALGISSMKVFGFSEDQSEEQGLIMPGSANIAFAWDSTDVMNIEYRIPLSFFGETSSLDQKDISIGWKVNSFQYSPNHSSESSTGEGRHGGGGYGGEGRHGGGGYGGEGYNHGNSNAQQGGENMMKEQSVWTRYIFKE